ncbi:hypothetical protein C2S52_010959 [Perilla frutescens var. hirtella]|uniref:RRM domain-containing protein n=1 Tax=Perilla frutescens var. hirtella TaxID=608512 RepID=A0AAD4J2X0_PERFH|nr:hypothetical protein C2S52_010959 [Perilla frutescens var. hirtella]KAH6817767.1 hypothetical protein C2S51_001370 [Perilla frutescens var. frutescens]KAH6825750.1 hypothetical protein C2S53_006856 [Perilla frutescens var. hirtella]
MSKLNANAQPFVVETATSKLSANAQPFMVPMIRVRTSDSDDRTLFMTFSSGSPLTKEEIFHYFTSVFGQCVERVYVHERRRKDPEFGKITFTPYILAEMIMLNRKVVKILVNNKPIWLKKYVSRSQRKLLQRNSELAS